MTPPPTSAPRSKGLLAGVVLLLASLLASLGIVELGLRTIHYAPGELHLFRKNPYGTGSYRLRPNLYVTAQFDRKKIVIKTNAHGMRWREVSVSKPPTSRRIAFVGDSFTFGQWADSIEESFVRVFEDQMAPAGVEALNFGVPGYGLLDVELLIREQVLQFEPDCLVVMFDNGNDFLDTYLGLDRYSVNNSGDLVPNSQVLERKIPEKFRREARNVPRSLREHVYVVRVLSAGLDALFPVTQSPLRRRLSEDKSYTSDLFWSRTRYPEFAVRARESTLDALARIAILCKQKHVDLRIVAIPSMVQVRSPTKAGGEYRNDLPQRYLAEFAASHSVPFLDLLPGLVAHVRESGAEIYHPVDGHFNNEGHRATGGLLASFLASQTGEAQRAH